MDDSTSGVAEDFETHATEEPPRVQKTRTPRIQVGGKILRFGRRPPAEASRLEDAKRAEYARTGKVTGATSVRIAAGYVTHRDDPLLWAEDAKAERRRETPVHQLMLEVLEDAKRVLARATATAAERLEAERWFARNDRSDVFAFLTICDELDLDAIAIRREVRP